MDMTTRRAFLAALGAMTAAGFAPLAPSAAAGVAPAATAKPGPGVVSVADYMPTDGKSDVADKIQRVIDGHPNMTIWFPDGTYLISKPICTPADPRRSVDLRLANYAVLKAAPGWTNTEAMVRLGGIHPANNIRVVGSCYSFTGGVIDGGGVAKGISIDSGRETKVRDVSMKFVSLGLHIKRGANSNSSDCDISDVNIVGNKKKGSVGVLIESCDNTLANMRIADMQTGVRLTRGAAGNLMTNLHPLYTNPMDQYDGSAGFADDSRNNSYNRCYSDQFSTGFLFGRTAGGAVMDACIAFWYASAKGRRHTAVKSEGRFLAQIENMQISFKSAEAVNTVLEIGEKGGSGYLRDPRIDKRFVRKDDTVYKEYLQGAVHEP